MTAPKKPSSSNSKSTSPATSETSSDEAAKLVKENESLKTQLAKAEEKAADAATSSDEAAKLAKEIVSLKTQLSDAESKAADGATSSGEAAKLSEENENLKAQLAEAEGLVKAAEGKLARETFSPADQKLVNAKVATGLSREQAEAVVKAQKAHDASIAESEEEAAE